MTKLIDLPIIEHELSGFTIEKLSKVMKLSFSRRLLMSPDIDVTVDQWVCMKLLHDHGHLNQQQLSELSLKDAPTLVRIIDKLEDKNLLTRSTDHLDRRKTNLSLTKKGITTVAKIKPILQSFRAEAYNGITKSELQAMEEIVYKIFNNLNIQNQ
ncbi:MAG: MarR family transcriptional regulator [Saprospiraceae bacterium]